MKIIGLVANTEKLDAARVLREAVQLFQKAGFQLIVETDTAHLLEQKNSTASIADIARRCEALVVLGGDGTILRVARDIHGSEIPILSVNLGTLGFLTSILQKDLAPTIQKLKRGDFKITERAMLDVKILRGKQTLSTHHGLNDVVITRGAFSRLVRIEVEVDGELLNTYTCDGLIVTTPTGSTAYSLSAGGPIIVPNADSLAITPICPHTLSNRSVIVAGSSVIRAKLMPQTIRARSNEPIECLATVDGQEQAHLGCNDLVETRQSASRLHMIVLPGHSHFEVLRHKLHWSGSNV